jgi:hypothetical protein
MKTQTAAEIIGTIFFSLTAAGGHDFKRHAGSVITEAISAGVIRDQAAVKYLTRLAQIASEPAPPSD